MYGRLVQCITSDGVRLDGIWTPGESNHVWLVTHGVNGNFYGSSLLLELADHLHQSGFGVLLVNNRGHDLSAFSADPVPHRIGSQFEEVSDCCRDFAAWESWCRQTQRVSLFGIAAHSLGAVKAAYWLAHRGALDASSSEGMLQRFWALSPPRLNTSLLLKDPKKADVFREHLDKAREYIDQGQSDTIMRVRFPLPNWVSAKTFFDKYGSGDKYDYLSYLDRISVPTLWTFGDSEVRNGSLNFLDADIQISAEKENRNLFQHSVAVIDDADHSYRGVRQALFQSGSTWLAEK